MQAHESLDYGNQNVLLFGVHLTCRQSEGCRGSLLDRIDVRWLVTFFHRTHNPTTNRRYLLVESERSNPREGVQRKLGPLMDSVQDTIDQFFSGRQKADLLEANALYVSVLEVIGEYFGTCATVLVFVDDDRDFERIFNVGYAGDFIWREKVAFGDGALSRCIRDRKVDVLPEVVGDDKYISLCAATRSQISIPLADSAGEPFGAIGLEFDRELTEDGVEFAFTQMLRPLSRIIAYIDSTLAMLQMRSVLELISNIPVSRGRFDDIVDAVFTSIETITADGELALLYRVGGSLVVTNVRHLEGNPARLQIGASRGQGYTAWSAHTGQAHYCKNTDDRITYPFYREVSGETKSQYTIPLVIRNEVIGVLNVGAKVPFAFSLNQRRLLDAIGRHATYAIFYWRLYRDIALISHEAFSRLDSVSYLRQFLLNSLQPSKRATAAEMMDSVEEAKQLVEAASYPFLASGDDPQAILSMAQEVLKQREDGPIRHLVQSPITRELLHPIQATHLKDFLNIVVSWGVAQLRPDERVLTTEVLEENYEGVQYIVFRWTLSVEEKALEGLKAEDLDDLVSIRRGGPTSQRIAATHLSLWKADKILANYGGYLDIDSGGDAKDEIIIRGTIRR